MLNLGCDKAGLSILFSPSCVIFYIYLMFLFPHIDTLGGFFFSSIHCGKCPRDLSGLCFGLPRMVDRRAIPNA